MYYYVNGKLAVLEQGIAVVDCGGVGYKLSITANTYKHLGTIGEMVKLYTYLNVREDILDLFGFYDFEEQNCFKQLISVSGVGPKAALSILSELSPEQFAIAIVLNDAKALTRAQGIGAKLASRIILELKDKIKNEQLSNNESDIDILNLPIFGAKAEAVNALSVLGYSKYEAQDAVKKCGLSDTDGVENIIRAALKLLMKN